MYIYMYIYMYKYIYIYMIYHRKESILGSGSSTPTLLYPYDIVNLVLYSKRAMGNTGNVTGILYTVRIIVLYVRSH
jgi:hypothetical protein